MAYILGGRRVSREIKVRAWANGYKKYCEYVEYADGVWIGYVKAQKRILSTTNVVIEQDTGLKDKNGKEICEGDIVEFDDSFMAHIGKIIFQGGSFKVVSSNDLYIGQAFHSKYVIGNIHENQELLGGKE